MRCHCNFVHACSFEMPLCYLSMYLYCKPISGSHELATMIEAKRPSFTPILEVGID